MMISPLFDKEFINLLYKEKNRQVFAKITILDKRENAIEYIQGIATDGSVKIDGKSILRRTCNLTLVASEVNIRQYYWGLKNKFKLEIGLKNNINKNYPDIIWFKLGIYVITQFDTTHNTKNWTIKISGKDKMCLLNGEVSGNLAQETDFGREQNYNKDTDTVTYTLVPLKTIVQNILTEFAGEPLSNIIINDLEEPGLELLEYRGDKPAYMRRRIGTDEFEQFTLENQKCIYKLRSPLTPEEYNKIPSDRADWKRHYHYNKDKKLYMFYDNEEFWSDDFSVSEEDAKGCFADDFLIIYDKLNKDFDINNPTPTTIYQPWNKKDDKVGYKLVQIEYGDAPGYYLTDLTYAGELIGKAGETLTSILDKIKKMLNNFEYFYDINGKFVFQKKTDYLSFPWNNNSIEGSRYEDAIVNTSEVIFNFVNGNLVESYGNKPKLTDVKNDFTVWGSYNLNGKEHPIHMRCAIDEKPIKYKPLRVLKEETYKIKIDENDNILYYKATEKNYDAPIVEPYDRRILNTNYYIYTLILLIKNVNLLKKLDRQFTEDKYVFSLGTVVLNTLLKYNIIENNEYFIAEIVNELQPILETYDLIHEDKDNLFYFSQFSVDIIKNLLNICASKQLNTEIYHYSDFSIQEEKTEDGDNTVFLIQLSYYAKFDFSIYKQKIKEGNYQFEIYPVDWRELIYQMALDYRKLHYTDDFTYNLYQLNTWCQNGKTGYEQYYIDLEGFWRTLYDPNPEKQFDPIPFNNVNTLFDQNSDNIYIDSKFSLFTEQDYDENEFTPEQLCVFESTKDDSEKLIYPFINSSLCCLDLGDRYYISNPGGSELSLTPITAQLKGDKNYNILNSNNMNSIYVKNSDIFQTKSLLDNRKYSNFQTKISNDIHVQFEVSKHFGGNLTAFEDNYITIIDQKLIDLKENKFSWPMIYQKKEDYMSVKDIQKISKDIYNQYYQSDFQIFKLYASELKEKITNELNKKVLYMANFKSVMSNILNYVNLMTKYNTDINDAIKDELDYLALETSVYVSNFLDGIVLIENNNLNQIVSDISDIRYIINTYKEKRQTSGVSIYEIIAYLTNSIFTKLNNLFTHIDEISIPEDDQDLEAIKKELQQYKEKNLSTVNEDGLISKIINKFNNFYNLLSSIIYIGQELPRLITNSNIDFRNLKLYYLRDNSFCYISKELEEIVTTQDKDGLISYYENSVNFQQYLVNKDINHFDYLISGKYVYQPIKYYKMYYNYNHNNELGDFWSTTIIDNPSSLLFWIDFLGMSDSTLAKYSVPAIGDRTKVVNDNNVKAINYKEVPQVIFKRNSDNIQDISGYIFINITPSFEPLFQISSNGKTAKDRMDELIYTNGYCPETITLSIIPIYTLEPNHRIGIRDNDSDINGEYIIESMNIPLSHKKTMSITASKATTEII